MDRTMVYRRVRVSRPQSQDRESAVTLRRRIRDDDEDLLDGFGQLTLRDNESNTSRLLLSPMDVQSSLTVPVYDQRNCRCIRGCRLCDKSYYRTTYDNVESPVYFRVTEKQSRDSWTHQGMTTVKRVMIRRKTIRY